MSDVFISAFAALAGSAIGGLSGVATTWLTLSAQERGRRVSQAMSRRETLYGEFVDEAAKLLTDAIGHKLDDASKFVHIYALISKLRLFASIRVILAAEDVMTKIIESYEAPVVALNEMVGDGRRVRDFDILRSFGAACRGDLDSFGRLPHGVCAGIREDEPVNE